MSATPKSDWNPGAYDRFRGLRLRPAQDLLAPVPDLPAGDVIDLGCGSGAAGPLLRVRFPDRRLIGVDASPAMLAKAEAGAAHDQLIAADIAGWRPETPPALIFSNAVLHWLDNHPRLMPDLAALLVPGGVLAVQMPGNYLAPSHLLLRATAARLCPEVLGQTPYVPPVAGAEDYLAMLSNLGEVDAWVTCYTHHLAPLADGGHPVRAFTESTAMRPFLHNLSDDHARAFVADYEEGLALAYPRRVDGSVLFAFRRVFFVLTRA
ncbi:MAG: methyltransferase domain-containing protein [Pararhodobacter sp.]|nr:methyltransferase domain-containing protein [Pararhodobacter sp.]